MSCNIRKIRHLLMIYWFIRIDLVWLCVLFLKNLYVMTLIFCKCIKILFNKALNII